MMPTYRGRFAPSPTGPLHFGSLVAAMASYADARAAGGEWLVRMEHVDAPRTVPGAADEILAALEAYGIEWTGPVIYQSTRGDIYREAFDRLDRAGYVYPCACSRKDIVPEGVYPGTCRDGLRGRQPRAWRLRVSGCESIEDLVQGHREEDLATETGDFVLRRADGLWAYQLAVVVDDALQGITHVVRGADLLSSTARQIYQQRLLDYPRPAYLHVPIAVDASDEKLSKQTAAAPLDLINPSPALAQAAAFLGHPVPSSINGCPPAEMWQWLIPNWTRTRIPAYEKVREY